MNSTTIIPVKQAVSSKPFHQLKAESGENTWMNLVSIVLLSYMGLSIFVAIIIVMALDVGYPVVW